MDDLLNTKIQELENESLKYISPPKKDSVKKYFLKDNHIYILIIFVITISIIYFKPPFVLEETDVTNPHKKRKILWSNVLIWSTILSFISITGVYTFKHKKE